MADYGAVPSFSLANYLVMNSATSITASTPLTHIEAILAGFGSNFVTNETTVATYRSRL